MVLHSIAREALALQGLAATRGQRAQGPHDEGGWLAPFNAAQQGHNRAGLLDWGPHDNDRFLRQHPAAMGHNEPVV